MRLSRESDRVKSLRQIGLLRDLERSDLEQIARISHEVERQPGEVLMRQGDLGTELLLILDGTARVEMDGRVVEEAGPNRVLGEMALIDSEPRSASVIATTPCALLVVPYSSFWEFIARAPAIQRQLLITLSRRVRSLNRQLAEASGGGAPSYA